MGVTSPKNLIIGGLGAAVIALGGVVVADRALAPATSGIAAATVASSQSNGAALSVLESAGGAMKVLQRLSDEIGVPTPTILAEIRAGKTLNQIAGPKATKLRDDILAAVQKGLSKAVAKGAITAGDEARLLADATDAVNVVMNAKLGALYSGMEH